MSVLLFEVGGFKILRFERKGDFFRNLFMAGLAVYLEGEMLIISFVL